jgi:hypothetical protein
MIDLRPHRLWLGLLALALATGFGSAPAIGIIQNRQQAKLLNLRADYDRTHHELEQLRADIAATDKLKSQIGTAEAEKSLAPVDRLRVAQTLERRAAESHLENFSYTLSPERKTPVETVGAGRQDLATSQLTLTANVPTDIDGYIFFDTLRRSLPGRLTLREISLERIAAVDAPLSSANLKLSVSGEWLSNGASQNLAEQAP